MAWRWLTNHSTRRELACLTKVMKKAMKVIAVILLLAGIGRGGLGVYGYYFSEDQARCDRYFAEAQRKVKAVEAAAGTPEEAALTAEAREELAVTETACGNAKQTRQNGMLMGLGGLISIIISVVLMIISRKRAA